MEIYLNPNKKDGAESTKALFRNLTKQFFENADMAKAYPNLFKLLWFSNIPCFKNNVTSSYLLKKCLWQGVQHDCTDLFKQIPTDSGSNTSIFKYEQIKCMCVRLLFVLLKGMCCAFNSKSALSKSAYSDLVKEMQGSQKSTGGEQNVRKIRTGLANGLTVWLDQHGDETSMGTVYDNYNGFKVSV